MGEMLRLLISIPFVILFPVAVAALAVIPFAGLFTLVKTIQSGYAAPNQLFLILNLVLLIIFVSMYIRRVRNYYFIFPFLFKLVEFLLFISIIILISVEFLNWRYEVTEPVRIAIGNMGAIVILLLGRICLSVYYYRTPILPMNRYRRY